MAIKFPLFFCAAFFIITLSACTAETAEPKTLEELYYNTLRASEKNLLLSSSDTDFAAIINSYPGTKYANYARLRLAELYFRRLSLNFNSVSDLENAETYYRTFIIVNPSHSLEPYILDKLMQLTYIRSVEGIFIRGIDSSPYFKAIQTYSNFLLAYPDSVYLTSVSYIAQFSQGKLAEFEERVGDWYYSQRNFAAAIGRYYFVFENFPLYDGKKELAKKLIESYRRNFQADFALKYQNVYNELYPN